MNVASPSAQEMGIATCGDLLPLSKEQLGQHFGKKVGETMWHYVRGTDERPLTTFKVRCTLRRGVSLARHLRPGVHVFVSVHPPCSNANRWASM
jgi:nucleotidyltransferase/DNA polymerase involved in DNA repair